MPTGVLVCHRDHRGPQRAGGAGTAGPDDDVVLAAVGQGQGHARIWVGVGSDVGYPSGGSDAGHAVLIGGPGEQPAEPASGELGEPPRSLPGRGVPHGLAHVGAGGLIGLQVSTSSGQYERARIEQVHSLDPPKANPGPGAPVPV